MSDQVDDMLSLAGNDLCLRWMITLLHFLWQGAAIGLSAAVLSRILRDASASVRYRLHSLALLGLPACVAVTFAMVYVPSTVRQQVPEIARVELPATSGPELDSVHITNQTAASESTSASASLAETPIDKQVVDDRVPEHRQHRIESQSLSWADLAWLAPWISAIYVCGVVLFLMRLGMGLWGGHRLRSITKPLSDSAVTQYIREQANRLGLRIIPLVGYCENVAVPTVIGVLRPMILLPASVVTGLSPQELAAVLSHELAHIRRYDLWMNLMQRMIESLLFFHPVVWFISRRVSVEREICCDDLVVRAGHAPMSYAGALLRMAELCVTVNKSHLAVLAAAGHSPAELELRIERLMNVGHRASLRLTRAGVVLVIGSLLACVAAPAMLAAMGRPNTREMLAFDELTQTVPTDFDLETGKNVRWRVPLGSVTMRAPLVHADQIYVGTNNHHAYNSRYPTDVDLGVLLCFRKSDGKFLWQHSNEKLPTGRAHDWPLQGVTSRPCVEGDRLWYITNRCEIVCLDTQGFHDLQNDGVIKDEVPAEANEADVVWRYDMMAELGVRPHNISTCTVAIWKDRIFAVTGNGVGESHQAGVADAPSFIALDKQSGQLLWSDNSPGQNVLHGQWGSPVVAELAGRTQVIFPGGDGWLYSFDPLGGPDGRSSLIWKFDCNPKDSTWVLGGRGTRNNLFHAPTVHQGLLYIAMGQDPEHGSGPGRVWCIDPSGTGDVSPELVFNKSDPETLVPHRRAQACIAEHGDFKCPNPNSKAVWQFTGQDVDGNGELTIEESMSRSLSSISIKDDLLFVSDVDGILHCLDRRTGSQQWGFDFFANVYSTPLIAGQYVYIGNEDGDLSIFGCSGDPSVAFPNGAPLRQINFGQSINASAVIDENVIYVATKNELIAIGESLPGENREALSESKSDDGTVNSAGNYETNVGEPEIRYPHCIVDSENLPERTLAEGIAQFNRTSLESPIGRQQSPITEQETRDAIDKFVAESQVSESVRTQLQEVLRSGKLPSNIYFRRFTRLDDEHQMQGVWWVRLCVEGDTPPMSSVAIRATERFVRPYTQLERRQNSEAGVTLINRFSSYFDDEPRVFQPAEFPDDKATRMIDRARASIASHDLVAFQSLFDWKGVSEPIREFVNAEFELLAKSTIHSIQVSPRNYRGELFHWSAYQYYQPNLPVVGYLNIEYTAAGDPAANRKRLSLEMGDASDDFRLVNYIETGERSFPKGEISGLSTRGHTEQRANGTYLVTFLTTNPGTLLSAHLANEEIWLRDYDKKAKTTRVEGVVLNSDKQPIAGAPIAFLAFEGDSVNAFKPIYLVADNDGRFTADIPSRKFRAHVGTPNDEYESMGEFHIHDGVVTATLDGLRAESTEEKTSVIAILQRTYQMQFDVSNASSGESIKDVAILYKQDEATWYGNEESEYATDATWAPFQIIENGNQTFQAPTRRIMEKAHILIAAKGFQPVSIKLDEDLQRGQLIVKRVQMNATSPVEFVLTTASDEPVIGATLTTLKSKELRAMIPNLGGAQLERFLNINVKSNAQGLVRFPWPAFSNWTTYRLENPSGYVNVRGKDLPKAAGGNVASVRTVRITPYATLTGKYLPQIKENEFLEMYRLNSNRLTIAGPEDRITLDQSGRFEVAKLHSGWFTFVHRVRIADHGTTAIAIYGPFELKEGEVREVNLGSEGRSVTGRFLLPDSAELRDRNLSVSVSSEKWPGYPQSPRDLDGDASVAWWNAFWTSEEGKQFREYQRRDFSTAMAVGNTFYFPSLPPGKYKLRLSERQAAGTSSQLAETEFEVPDDKGTHPLDLGELKVGN